MWNWQLAESEIRLRSTEGFAPRFARFGNTFFTYFETICTSTIVDGVYTIDNAEDPWYTWRFHSILHLYCHVHNHYFMADIPNCLDDREHMFFHYCYRENIPPLLQTTVGL